MKGIGILQGESLKPPGLNPWRGSPVVFFGCCQAASVLGFCSILVATGETLGGKIHLWDFYGKNISQTRKHVRMVLLW